MDGFETTNDQKMRHILDLHFKIQRRSYLEMYALLFIMCSLTFFVTVTYWIHASIPHPLSMGMIQLPPHIPVSTDTHRLHRRNRERKKRIDDTSTITTQRQLWESTQGIHFSWKDRIQAVQRMHVNIPNPPPFPMMDRHQYNYDIHDCPSIPPKGYPVTWNVLQVLEHWNPDVTSIPSDFIYQSICVFDYENPNHRQSIRTYRNAELPFVMVNHPEVMNTSFRWSFFSPQYMDALVGTIPHRNEYSTSNHFLFWRTNGPEQPTYNKRQHTHWKAPTKFVNLTFSEWYTRAIRLEQNLSNPTDPSTTFQQQQQQANTEHWYFRLNSNWFNENDNNLYLYDELPFFKPSIDFSPTLFMVDSRQHRGINCRFGMKGAIAEMHFDPTRNWIVLLHGQRRYILAHPDQCQNLEMYPIHHPSGRHSSVNWSTIATRNNQSNHTEEPPQHQQRPFAKTRVNEVALQAGDALYLPTSWFHFIVSLNLNYQCNARSGATYENRNWIRKCGF
jgi:hypothetical protein